MKKRFIVLMERNYERSYKPYFGNTAEEAGMNAMEDGWGFQRWRIVAIFTDKEWENAIARRGMY